MDVGWDIPGSGEEGRAAVSADAVASRYIKALKLLVG